MSDRGREEEREREWLSRLRFGNPSKGSGDNSGPSVGGGTDEECERRERPESGYGGANEAVAIDSRSISRARFYVRLGKSLRRIAILPSITALRRRTGLE